MCNLIRLIINDKIYVNIYTSAADVHYIVQECNMEQVELILYKVATAYTHIAN